MNQCATATTAAGTSGYAQELRNRSPTADAGWSVRNSG